MVDLQIIRHYFHFNQKTVSTSAAFTGMSEGWGEHCFVYFGKPFMNVRVLISYSLLFSENSGNIGGLFIIAKVAILITNLFLKNFKRKILF